MGNFSIDFVPLTQETGVSQQQHFKEINAGAGTTSFGLNEFGLRMGAPKFEDAPFRLTYDGVLNLAGVNFSADEANNLVIASDTNTFFFDGNGHYLGKFFYLNGFYGLELQGGGRIQFTTGAKITDSGSTIDFDRTTVTDGDVATTAGKKFQVGSSGGVNQSSTNVGGLFQIEIKGGIITYFQKY